MELNNKLTEKVINVLYLRFREAVCLVEKQSLHNLRFLLNLGGKYLRVLKVQLFWLLCSYFLLEYAVEFQSFYFSSQM